jgi:hypothetical protein
VCNEWPDLNYRWFEHAEEAADELDRSEVPDHLRSGIKTLFRHMILQNADQYRRHAVETVVTSGWNAPVARALETLLREETEESWLRIRALLALSSMQKFDLVVEDALISACKLAYTKLMSELDANAEPSLDLLAELQASLFAIGDYLGAASASDRSKNVRESLRSILIGLVATGNAGGEKAIPIGRSLRAVAYLLTMAAQPREGEEMDLSQALLRELRGHPDDMTALLSNWALSFRFRDDGTVRPLLAATRYGMRNDG